MEDLFDRAILDADPTLAYDYFLMLGDFLNSEDGEL